MYRVSSKCGVSAITFRGAPREPCPVSGESRPVVGNGPALILCGAHATTYRGGEPWRSAALMSETRLCFNARAWLRSRAQVLHHRQERLAPVRFSAQLKHTMRGVSRHRNPNLREQAGQAPQPTSSNTRSATMICCSRDACQARSANSLPPYASHVGGQNCRPPS
jgi:hypothetical protein